MAEEISIFRDANIHVTNLRAMLQDKTYAMANVTSVSMFTQSPDNTGAAILVGLGALIFLAGFGSESIRGCSFTFGPIMLVIGAAILLTSKNVYWVRIGSASGETNAISSRDRDYIMRIVNAMNEAIVRRG